MLTLLRTLSAGGALLLLQSPRPERLTLTPGQFWSVAALSIALSFWASFFGTEPPRVFVPDALQTQGFLIALTLATGFSLAKILALPELSWRLPVLLAAAGLVLSALNRLVYDWLLPGLDAEATVYLGYYYLTWLWCALITERALKALAPAQTVFKRSGLALGATLFSIVPGYCLDYQDFWRIDYRALAQQTARDEQSLSPEIAEEILYRQSERLAQALQQVAQGQPGTPDLYFVAFGGYGAQDVFMKEVLYTRQLFQEQLGARGRSIALINNPKLVSTFPLASVTNLRTTLHALAERMDRDEDILFLFLTSHGTREHGLSVQLKPLPLQDLSPAKLAGMLKETAIQWKVIVVSACYSGSFIETLSDERTLVITASRADRNSFGCSDSAEFTYFGRAFFTQALTQTHSLIEAFARAKELIERWEREDGYLPSEPQIASAPAIEAKLKEWQASLKHLAKGAQPPGCTGQPC